MSEPVVPPTSLTRRHRSREERRQLVASWRSSGQTRSAFARAHGLHPKSLGRWISEDDASLDESGEGRIGFVPAIEPVGAGTVHWRLPGDLGLVTATTPGDLAQVLRGVLGDAR